MDNNVPFKEAVKYYEDHPAEYIEEVCGSSLDQWQKDVCKDLAENKFVAIRSGSGVGKTFLLARLVTWFLTTKPFSKVPCTAPSKHQLFDLLWSQCHIQIESNAYLKSMLEWKHTSICVRGYEPDWYAAARTAGVSPGGVVSEGLSGFHADDNLLFVLDEASGLKKQVIPAVEGALTGKNAYCIVASNPSRDSGFFYDIFHDDKVGGKFKKHHISCMDSPRVTDEYIEYMLTKYGEDHPIYRIKVLGEFPLKTDGYLMPPAYIEAMKHNITLYNQVDLGIEIGLDIGRSKAPTVACIRRGLDVLEYRVMRRTGGVDDIHKLTSWGSDLINEFEPTVLRIDAIYMPGVYDNLHVMFPTIVVPVIGNAKALDIDKYVNLRAEGFWTLKQLVPKLCCRNWPDEVIEELGNIKEKNSKQTGKLGVESKEEMLARRMLSPNHADATMYAFMNTEGMESDLQAVIFSRHVAEINDDLVSESELLSTDHVGSKWLGLLNRMNYN